MICCKRVLIALVVSLALFATPADAEISSYYGHELEGSLTASGEPFVPYGYTAASLDYPLGTWLQVCYPETELCTVVVVNDHGPYVDGRHIDLSLGAALDIGLTDAGVDYVEVCPL